MSTIKQFSLFSWDLVNNSPEILRLKRILDVLPDQDLMKAIREDRKGRRDDYPLEVLWNTLLAGVVFGHESVASLIRELRRNAELRQVCGFDPLLGDRAVPDQYVYSRFFNILSRHLPLIDAMFDKLVEEVSQLLPDFGKDIAVDGKKLPILGRKDKEADWGVKVYEIQKEDGTIYESIKKWFGYKLHLIVDANYELPIAYQVTKASEAESPLLIPMMEELRENHPHLHERIETVAADKGYDDGEDKRKLYDDHGVSPIIDTRFIQKKGMLPLDEQTHDAIYFNPTGDVFCKVDPFSLDEEKCYARMQFMGFEKKRECLKFHCPAKAYGIECKNQDACKCQPSVKNGNFGRTIRIPLDRDRRLFLPVHRHSKSFERKYKKRTSVERVNSRIDQVYGFERHFIRGKTKMTLRVGIAMIVMLATAVAWIKAGQQEKIRCLNKAA